MKSTNITLFGRELQTTTLNQGQSYLHRVSRLGPQVVDEFCCLGVGCRLAKVPVSWNAQFDDPDWDDGAAYDGPVCYAGSDELPPGEFYEWLGFENAENLGNEDVHLDIPPEWTDRKGHSMRIAMTLACLNDTDRMPFKQVGDLVLYFGLVPGPVVDNEGVKEAALV